MTVTFSFEADVSGPTGKDLDLLFASKEGIIKIEGPWKNPPALTPEPKHKVIQISAAKKKQRRDKERNARLSRRKNRSK